MAVKQGGDPGFEKERVGGEGRGGFGGMQGEFEGWKGRGGGGWGSRFGGVQGG